jgi:hypothetical protein
MIQSNELRIGDIVLRAKWLQKSYTLPNEWEYDQITVSHNDITACVVKPESFNPIPLTPEILEKCGFEKDIDDMYLETKHILFVSYNDDEFVHCKNTALDTLVSIKYLHQLQNLYFALTGEELTFKP